MKANLLYRLWVQMPTERSIVDPHCTPPSLDFQIEMQTPMWCQRYFGRMSTTTYPPYEFLSPLGNVASSSSPELRMDSHSIVLYLRGSSASSDYGKGHATIPVDVDFPTTLNQARRYAERLHCLLREWSLGDARIALERRDRTGVLSVLCDPIRFMQDDALLPTYEETTDERPLSPHFELESCIERSMQGACNNIFWV